MPLQKQAGMESRGFGCDRIIPFPDLTDFFEQ